MCNSTAVVDNSLVVDDVPLAARHTRRNHRLGIAAGAVGSVGMSFLHPELIFAGLVYALTGSPMLVAVLTVVTKASSLAPQLLASSFSEHRPRKMPYFAMIAALRALTLLGLVAAMWGLTQAVNALTLGCLFVAVGMVWAWSGAGHVLFLDMAGRMVRQDRLGAFFGTRHLVGNLLAMLSGLFIIQPVLNRMTLPWNYLVLAAAGGVLMTADMFLWTRATEADGSRAASRTTFRESLRRGWLWLQHDHNYRMYLGVRVAFRLNYLGLAFFIPYGVEKIPYHGPGELAMLGGMMIATMQIARMVGSYCWGRLADRSGFGVCLAGGSVCYSLAAMGALASPLMPEAFAVDLPFTEVLMNLPLAVYLLSLMVLGLASQGMIIGQTCFMVSHAPRHRRPSYVGFMNTVTCPLTLLPLAGAWLAGAAGMGAIFWIVIFGGLVSAAFALRMRPHSTRAEDID